MSAKETAKRNDLLRRSLPCICPPNLAVLTKGVASLGNGEVNRNFQPEEDALKFKLELSIFWWERVLSVAIFISNSPIWSMDY